MVPRASAAAGTRSGLPTIYAARELSTAWAEYNQSFVQHPALIAQLELRHAWLADMMAPDVLADFGVTDDIHREEWRDALDQGVVPATHRLQAELTSRGFDGLIYPSFMSPGGSCVALWRWNAGGAELTVIDPESRLPKTPASWL